MPGPAIVLPFLLAALAAYLLGSISFSIIITRIFTGTDVRQHGSGNAGATNVLRTAGKLASALTFAGDFLKCVASICIGIFIFRVLAATDANLTFWQILFGSSNVQITFIKFVAGLFCMLGHIYPLYFGFRGGKGVVTAAALMLLISWQCFLIAIGIFLILAVLTRIVSLSVIVAAISLPFSAYGTAMLTHSSYAWLNALLAGLMAAILITMHRANIKRLLNGTEPRLGKKNPATGK